MTIHPGRFSAAIEGDFVVFLTDEDQQAHEDPIYAHFPDRDAIVTAVMDECFAELTTAINRAAADGLQAPAGRLRAGSQGYMEYSRTVRRSNIRSRG
jgi:hypothetical protein